MKKLVKSICIMAMVLAIVFAFAGCKIVILEGTWEMTEGTVEIFEYTDSDMTKLVRHTTQDSIASGEKATFVVEEDGTGTYTVKMKDYISGSDVGPFVFDFTWEETDNGIVIEIDGAEMEFVKQGTQLVWEKETIDKTPFGETTKTVTKIVLTRTGK